MRIQYAICCCALLFAPAIAAADDSDDTKDRPAAKDSSKRETIVYSARGVPARELAATLGEMFDTGTLRVTAEPTSNLVIMQVSAGSREAVLGLLEKLDRPLRSMLVQLYLLKTRGKDLKPVDSKSLSGPADEVAKTINSMEDEGRIYTANRMELTVVENQKAMLQVGERVAVATGQTITPRGSVNQYTDHSVGTLISLTTRASEDGSIAMNLQFEKSEVVTPETKKDSPFQPPSTSVLTQETTLVMRSGHSTLAGTLVDRGSDGSDSEAYLVVAATLLKSDGRGSPVIFRSFSQNASRVERRTDASRGFSRPATGAGESSRSSRASYDRYAKAMVERYDTNRDGSLTSDEWKSMARSPEQADANKDEKISVEEFSSWLRREAFSSTRRGARPETTRPSFEESMKRYAAFFMSRYDVNDDKVIDVEERKKSSRDLSDADADGNGKITSQELTEWLLTRARSSRESRDTD